MFLDFLTGESLIEDFFRQYDSSFHITILVFFNGEVIMYFYFIIALKFSSTHSKHELTHAPLS